MKKCIRCSTVSPINEFYKHKGMLDGRLNKCKKCCKVRTVWQNIHSRCYDVNYKDFANYGQRGIYVVDAWHKLSNFEQWYHDHYVNGLQVDRIDNNGPYSPENCHMVTGATNCRNRRTSKLNQSLLELADKLYNNGYKMFEIAKELNISRGTITSAFRGHSWRDFKFSQKVVQHYRSNSK